MPLLVMAVVGTYIEVAGRTGSCPACVFITETVGLSEPAPGRGEVVADWSLAGLEGGGVESSELKGRVVLVNFWSTGCLPCRRELPHLQALQERLGPEGLSVIGVVVDRGDPAAIREFVESRGLSYPVGLVTDSVIGSLGPVEAVPTTLVLDREGRLVQRLVGYQPEGALRAAVKRQL